MRLKERFGNPSKNRPESEIIWINAVSVGEANSALILVEELLKFSPKISILFTTTTLTSASVVAAKNFQSRLIHQFLPVDSYFCVKNFLEFWQPRAAIFIESEIWPNLIFEARQMGIDTFLVNARLSQKSSTKWQLAKKFGFKIFDYFSVIFAQTKDDQQRLSKLTGQEILFYGNLKSVAADLAFDVGELEKLKSQIGSRKFWLAASTHKGEEGIITQVHKNLKTTFPDLLTIIVPRHPSRAEEIKTLLNGMNFAQRSLSENIVSSTEVYLADSLNELGIFYRLAPFAFIGGSLAPVGGHNPFEAIKLGCAVISGREVYNFKEIYENLDREGGCEIVASLEELTKTVESFLSDKNHHQTLANRALFIINNSENICQKIIKKINQVSLIGGDL